MSAWETSDRYQIVGVLLWLDDDCPRRGRNRYGCGEELGRFWCKFEPGSSFLRGRNRYGCGEVLGKFWCNFEPGSSHMATLNSDSSFGNCGLVISQLNSHDSLLKVYFLSTL